MKSILYVGATLMIGASIYGFVDYRQTHRKKEFKEMYTADVSKPPVDVTEETKITEPVEKKDIVVTNKKAPVKKPVATKKVVKKKKKINRELFSRGPIREEINFASEPEKKAKESKKTENKD